MTSTAARLWRWLFAAAVLAQLVALYLPDPPSAGGVPGSDKAVHIAIFLAPALLGVLAGLRSLLLGLLLVAHAVLSELVQHLLLPGRGGDPWDAVADVVGVGLGLAVGLLARQAIARRAASREAGSRGAAPPHERPTPHEQQAPE